jgi:Zn finger protein HypA/HybF involved in hydrogenase expression
MKPYNYLLHINYIKTEFNCPYCENKYNDKEFKYIDKCNKNKSWRTRIICECKEFFYLAIDSMGKPFTYKN